MRAACPRPAMSAQQTPVVPLSSAVENRNSSIKPRSRWFDPFNRNRFSRPDGFVALETIAVERIEPTRARVYIFAIRRISLVLRLLQRPAIRNRREDVRRWWQALGSGVQHVVWIGVEAMTKFAITARGRCNFSRKGSAEFGKARHARTSFS